MKNLQVPPRGYFRSRNSMWLLIAAVCICSCGEQEPAPTAPVAPSSKGEASVQRLDGTRVGVSLLNRTHQFYQDLEEGLRAEAARYGIELLIESAEGDSQALSEAICAEQKECQYLLLDETTCAELFAGFFDAAELAACRECQEAEECDAQQEACSSVCSMQNN